MSGFFGGREERPVRFVPEFDRASLRSPERAAAILALEAQAFRALNAPSAPDPFTVEYRDRPITSSVVRHVRILAENKYTTPEIIVRVANSLRQREGSEERVSDPVEGYRVICRALRAEGVVPDDLLGRLHELPEDAEPIEDDDVPPQMPPPPPNASRETLRDWRTENLRRESDWLAERLGAITPDAFEDEIDDAATARTLARAAERLDTGRHGPMKPDFPGNDLPSTNGDGNDGW